MTYNGYTNYETWAVSLWIDNDQEMYRDIESLAQNCFDSAEENQYNTKKENAQYNLEIMIKDYIEELNPLASDASLWSDLLGAALDNVSWREITENWIETIKENGNYDVTPDDGYADGDEPYTEDELKIINKKE